MNSERIHFSQLSKKQIDAMWNACVEAAIKYSDKIHMSGLSEIGSHDIYNALHDAIVREWENAKKAHENYWK